MDIKESGSRRRTALPNIVRWQAVMLGSALCLGGCATAPPIRPASVELPAAYDAAGSALPAATLDRWWMLYDDAQLQELIDSALERGFSVREAFARLTEARATRASALSRFGLQGNAQLTGEIRKTDNLSTSNLDISGIPGLESLTSLFAPSMTKTAGASLPISWELDLFGRRGVSRDVADADLAAARFNYESVRAMLAADVARGLFEARGLAAQLDDAHAHERIQRRLSELVRMRAERGLAATSEIDRVESDLAQAQAQAADLAGALDASRRALLVLIGSGTAPIGSLPIAATETRMPQVPQSLPGDLLVRRPDIREAEARLAAQSGNVRLAELAFYPTITPQVTLGYNTQTGGLASTAVFGAIGGNILLPIFDRGRLKAELGGASARAEQAVLAYERIVHTAYSEVDQALTRLAADRQRVGTLEAGLARAQRAYDAALLRYRRGLSDLQEVLDAERTFRSARTALTSARVDALQRSVQTFQALGGGWAAEQTPQQSGI
ncbi:efflux transporter, outer membrane factor (OMF) lipoprotein, NodT family [Novosphingobium sp. CF614]|uniref:efflux transporter outer membrane subunit n=1 Tax=Novosphingobium sp. CF614 TaxID=1884364 RepID=UPI0008F2BE67|nr:TolC family protein [Novosphingobium sp. CF614]SFF83146.1 efflux transporter, outer membrane factor (OMF) lipoprotein, NodT family [Novosphingobium sp. CF614]